MKDGRNRLVRNLGIYFGVVRDTGPRSATGSRPWWIGVMGTAVTVGLSVWVLRLLGWL